MQIFEQDLPLKSLPQTLVHFDIWLLCLLRVPAALRGRQETWLGLWSRTGMKSREVFIAVTLCAFDAGFTELRLVRCGSTATKAYVVLIFLNPLHFFTGWGFLCRGHSLQRSSVLVTVSWDVMLVLCTETGLIWLLNLVRGCSESGGGESLRHFCLQLLSRLILGKRISLVDIREASRQ